MAILSLLTKYPNGIGHKNTEKKKVKIAVSKIGFTPG
jgi:hypothetical protein